MVTIEPIKQCDMCGSEIISGSCKCGTWVEPNEANASPFKKAIDEFHSMNMFVISGDAPHLGCAAIYFRGDYKDCQKVKQFIYELKGRPYYKDSSDN